MDEWLRLLLEDDAPGCEWEPDFEADQWLVQARIGPLRRFYLRPPGFHPRFYHRLYSLAVRLWRLDYSKALFRGLCDFQVHVKIRYQVTLAYVQRHPEALADLDGHVRTALEPLILDLLDHRTHLLQSGDWIETGLTEVRQEIEEGINLLLARHHLRCRTLCNLKPEFPGAEDEQLLLFQEKIYQAIEGRRRALQQLCFQEQMRRQQAQQQHEAELTRFRQEAERQREIAEGEHRKKLLEIRRRQQAEVREMEARLREEALKHRERLASMELEQRRRTVRRREAERRASGKPDEENADRQHHDRTPEADGRREEDEGKGSQAYQSLLRKLEFDTALTGRERDFPFADLEPQLKTLLDSQPTGTGLSNTSLAISPGWLRRLLQRLLFFLLGAR